MMRTCKPFSDVLSLKIVYYAYVRSILEYASPIWSVNYAIHKDRIEKIQKKFASHLNHKFKKIIPSTSYTNKCRQYNLLTLEDRRKLSDMRFLFDIINGRIDCPQLLSGLSFRAPKRRTRHTALFHVPFHVTKYGDNAVLSRIPRLYNMEFYSADPFLGSRNKYMDNIYKTLSEKYK